MNIPQQIDFLNQMCRGASPFVAKKLREIVATLKTIEEKDDE